MNVETIEIAPDVAVRMDQAVVEAEGFRITTPDTYRAACEFLLRVKDLQKEVAAFFKPMKKRADELKDSILDSERSKLDPLRKIEAALKGEMGAFERDQERIRREEEARRREEARRLEEDARIQEAVALEKAGEAKLAERVLEAPAFVPPVAVPKATPKVQGVSYRTAWKYEITDPTLIPRQFLSIDEKKIAGVVRSLGKEASIPGVRVYEDKIIAAGGR